MYSLGEVLDRRPIATYTEFSEIFVGLLCKKECVIFTPQKKGTIWEALGVKKIIVTADKHFRTFF